MLAVANTLTDLKKYVHPRARFLAVVEWRTLLEYFICSGAISSGVGQALKGLATYDP
jgi:hypothetical protein